MPDPRVDLRIGGILVATTTPANGAWSSLVDFAPYSPGEVIVTGTPVDGSGNAGQPFQRAFIRGSGADTTAPTAPTNFTATRTGDTTASLSWSAASDAVGVTAYRLVRTSRASGSVVTTDNITSTSATASGLSATSVYDYALTAVDAAGNRSTAATAVLNVFSAPADTTAPTTTLTSPAAGSTTNRNVTTGGAYTDA